MYVWKFKATNTSKNFLCYCNPKGSCNYARIYLNLLSGKVQQNAHYRFVHSFRDFRDSGFEKNALAKSFLSVTKCNWWAEVWCTCGDKLTKPLEVLSEPSSCSQSLRSTSLKHTAHVPAHLRRIGDLLCLGAEWGCHLGLRKLVSPWMKCSAAVNLFLDDTSQIVTHHGKCSHVCRGKEACSVS